MNDATREQPKPPFAATGDENLGAPRAARSRATLADIAREAGVTRMTVSNALNNRGGVSVDVRDRVQRIANEMGYVTNWVAQKLSASRLAVESGVIGVIAELHTPFMAEVTAAISAAVRDRGRDMLVYSLPEPDKDVPQNVLNLLLHTVDGVIAVLPRARKDLQKLVQARIPIVAVDRLDADATLPSVGSDSYQGARLAMRHLIELGHRRIGFLAGEASRFSARERLRGYLDAMAEAGLSVGPDDVAAGAFLQEAGRSATERLLQRRPRPTAVFAANDASALGALMAIHDAGLSAPEDVSVVGFDDISAASQIRPGLTTIRQPYPEIGSTAVGMLLGIIKQEPEDPQNVQVLLPVELVVRGTTAPCLAHH
jgi:LacI family transcriptional regulator